VTALSLAAIQGKGRITSAPPSSARVKGSQDLPLNGVVSVPLISSRSSEPDSGPLKPNQMIVVLAVAFPFQSSTVVACALCGRIASIVPTRTEGYAFPDAIPKMLEKH